MESKIVKYILLEAKDVYKTQVQFNKTMNNNYSNVDIVKIEIEEYDMNNWLILLGLYINFGKIKTNWKFLIENYIENSFGIAKNRNFAKNLISDNKNKIQNNIIHNPSKNFIESDLNDLKEGMEIEHKKFGYGLIKSIDKTQNHQKAVVNFKLVGEKTLLLSFARLRIVK